MSLAEKAKNFTVGHWRLLAVFAVIAAIGAIYIERQPLSASTPAPVAREAQAPAPPVPAAPPQTGVPPAADKAESPAGSEAPVESLAGQMIDVAARPVAILRGQGAWNEGLKTLSEAIAKVSAATARAGLAATGRPLAAFTETDENGFHFEAMIPIAKAPEGKGQLGDGVEIGASPAGKALKFQHRGPYDDIDTTYEAITAYLDEKGLDTQNVFIEEYLTDLKSGDDEGLEVDVYVFVK